MTPRALLLAGSAALLAVPASAGVTDFRLPPSRTPSPTPTTVGPVDPEAPPRPAPRPTPTATVTPAPTPAPLVTLPPAQTPTARATPTARPTAAPATGAAGPAPSPADTGEAPAGPDAAPTGFEIVTPPPAAPVTQPPEETEDGGWSWGWIAGLALLLGLLGAAGVWLRRRIAPRGTVLFVPDIEKPRVPPREPELEPEPPSAPEPAPAEAATAPASAGQPLRIAIEPLKLTQTVMNATLAYRLTLTNAGEAPLEGLSVAADLVAAHASLPREALLAFPETELPERHALPALAPGETIELKGELRLPLSEAMPIRQGTAVVFVPLARFRAGAAGAEPRCFTLVVGQPSPRGAIQPVRLDLGPRSTEGLTGLAF